MRLSSIFVQHPNNSNKEININNTLQTPVDS